MRAYLEINDFEDQLAEAGIVLTKFWIHISPEEQLRRFEERQRRPTSSTRSPRRTGATARSGTPTTSAVNDMVVRTSTRDAPWTLVAGNDKRLARIHILETVCRRLERAL